MDLTGWNNTSCLHSTLNDLPQQAVRQMKAYLQIRWVTLEGACQNFSGMSRARWIPPGLKKKTKYYITKTFILLYISHIIKSYKVVDEKKNVIN